MGKQTFSACGLRVMGFCKETQKRLVFISYKVRAQCILTLSIAFIKAMLKQLERRQLHSAGTKLLSTSQT